ncbi:MAG TPA: SDR family NAD(P)-dependent oxidoreductase [Puia sp.]|nr:SDR family NAD(P)-dependent oxidoreductase [Puia sp.]
MSTIFEGQTGIVTGAASGLGRAIAIRLSANGVKLALFDKDAAGLASITAALSAEHKVFPVDITDEEQVRSAVSMAAAEWGRIDLLVNSAGITGRTNIKSHEVDTEDLLRVWRVNFMGSYHTSKYVLPVMLRHNYGRILHIASIAGKEGNAGMLAYSSSKAAVIGMTKVQGKEYATTGITVNALAPAVIRTALVDAMPEEQVRYMTDKIPMQRCGTLDEAADHALFIVSPQTSFTTGFTFDLSGGRATY